MATDLTIPERSKLQRCEETIQRGLNDWLEVGQALLTIRDDGLYREGHDSFELYLEDRWDMKGRRAYQLIEAAVVVNDLETDKSGDTVKHVPVVHKPQNERQARELAKVSPKFRAAVMEEAAKDGKPTLGLIRAAAAKLRPKREPKPGKEITKPRHRKKAIAAYGVLVRALDRIGLVDGLSAPLDRILEAIKST